jgi:hypothetical protein
MNSSLYSWWLGRVAQGGWNISSWFAWAGTPIGALPKLNQTGAYYEGFYENWWHSFAGNLSTWMKWARPGTAAVTGTVGSVGGGILDLAEQIPSTAQRVAVPLLWAVGVVFGLGAISSFIGGK